MVGLDMVCFLLLVIAPVRSLLPVKKFGLTCKVLTGQPAQRPIHTGIDNSVWVLFIQSIDAFRVKQIRNPPESDVLRICVDTSAPGGPRALYNFLQSDAMLKVGRITHGLLICFDTARCNPIEKHANPRTNISDAKSTSPHWETCTFFSRQSPITVLPYSCHGHYRCGVS